MKCVEIKTGVFVFCNQLILLMYIFETTLLTCCGVRSGGGSSLSPPIALKYDSCLELRKRVNCVANRDLKRCNCGWLSRNRVRYKITITNQNVTHIKSKNNSNDVSPAILLLDDTNSSIIWMCYFCGNIPKNQMLIRGEKIVMQAFAMHYVQTHSPDMCHALIGALCDCCNLPHRMYWWYLRIRRLQLFA